MEDDKIIKEVRAAGKVLEEKCNKDIAKFTEMIKLGEIKSREEGWKIVSNLDLKKMKDAI